MEKEFITAAFLGIGLAASCGFRVFVPFLVVSIASKLGLIPLSEGFMWLSGWPAIVSFSVATIAEIGAYYIPFIDNLLDAVAVPMAVGGGTLLSASVLPVDNEMLRWILGFFIGGGSAGIIQGGTVVSRLASSKLSGGMGNVFVSTGENAAALSISVLSLFIPVIIGVILIVVIVVLLQKFIRKLSRK